MRQSRKDVSRESSDVFGARPVPRSDDGRQRLPVSHYFFYQTAHPVVGPVDVEEALEARDVRVAAERPKRRGFSFGQIKCLPAPSAAAAEARGLEGELEPFLSFKFCFFSLRLFVADGKSDPQRAAAQDALDAVAAVDQVPCAERVALLFFTA